MSIKLQLRRGLETDLPTLAVGEPGFCTDSYKLFIGSAAGNKGIAMLASPIFTGLVTLPGIRVVLGDAAKNLGIGTGALGSINVGVTVNDTVIGVGAMPSDQLTGENVVIGADAAKGISLLMKSVIIGNRAFESGATTQDTSVIIGANAAPHLDGCNKDIIIGQNAFHPALGSENVVIGTNAAHEGTTKNGLVFIGNAAGYYESGSNKLFIDNTNRASEADARLKALIYGVFDALTANQYLYFNSNVIARESLNSIGPLEIGPAGRNLKTWWNFEDFIRAGNWSYGFGIWIATFSGTGASSGDGTATALRPGILKFSTGTTTTGRTGIMTYGDYQTQYLFGGGVYTIEADINITTLSTATEAYAFRFGFLDDQTGPPADGAYFEYSDVGSTPNWYKSTASNSTRTNTDTTIAAATGWTRLKVVVNAAGTSVEYFINGVSVGVVTTNIPTGTGRETTAMCYALKSAGTTARLFYVDWAWLHIDLTTSR